MSTITIGYTATPGFPAGSVVDHIGVSIVGLVAANNQSQNVAPGTTTVTVTLNPDTYTISVQAFDVNNNAFGTAVSTTLVVSAPTTVTLNIPSSVTAQ